MISVGALAMGYLLMNVFAAGPNLSGDVCSTLFGSTSILTLTKGQVHLCVVLSVIVVIFFVLFYHKIFCVTFDETFVKATGIHADRYNLMIAVIIAVIGILLSILAGTPVGSSIVAADMAAFFISCVAGRMMGRR